MMLFDMEFIPIYPDNRLFAYMAATCDYQGNTQLYVREFKPIRVHRQFQKYMIKRNKVDDSNRYFIEPKSSYTYEEFKQYLLDQNKSFIELKYHQFIPYLRGQLFDKKVWGSGPSMDMRILNEGYQQQVYIQDLQSQIKFMFTTAKLMSSGTCAHFPDTELQLFYSIIQRNIPNTTGISFQQCSGDFKVDPELKLRFWDDALQHQLIDQNNYNIRVQKVLTQSMYY